VSKETQAYQARAAANSFTKPCTPMNIYYVPTPFLFDNWLLARVNLQESSPAATRLSLSPLFQRISHSLSRGAPLSTKKNI